MLKEGIKLLKPVIGDEQAEKSGKVIIGTIEGDLHDIGKNLVGYMLTGAGFEVHDLGVDVSAKEFAEAAEQLQPDVIGVSALLTTTMMKVNSVIEELEKKGLRSKVKVIVGGRPLTKKYADEIGADGYAEDAIKTVMKVKELIRKT
jgi:5-methyltetrahydrofolate--homocysteine methyltransferase